MDLISNIKDTFKKYFIIGVITVFPFVVTVNVILFVINYFDGVFAIDNDRFLFFIPSKYHPDLLFGFHIPLIGFLITMFLVLMVGVFSRNYLGKLLLRWGDKTMATIPGLGGIYNLVKQAAETFSGSHQKNFSRVVLIQYPHPGTHTLAFVTGNAPYEIQNQFKKEKTLSVFVPTTPNPTSGFYLVVSEKEVLDVEMTVEDAFKLILTAGVVTNDGKRREEIDLRR